MMPADDDRQPAGGCGAPGGVRTAREGEAVVTAESRRPATLVDRAADGCVFAIGEAEQRGRHIFCNRPRIPGRRYCAEHDARCFERPGFTHAQRAAGGRLEGG